VSRLVREQFPGTYPCLSRRLQTGGMNLVVALGAAAVSVIVGLLVLLRAAQRRIGCLLIAHGVCFGALLIGPGNSTSHAGMVVDQLGAGLWVFLFFSLVLIAYLVPDGHTLSPGWRRFMLLGLAGVAAFLVGSAGDANGFRGAHGGADPPVAWLPVPVSGVLGLVGLLLTVMLFFGAVFAVRARLRRSSGDARLQLLWLVWGATSLPLALMLAWIGHFALDDDPVVVNLALALAGVALPATIGIAILRYRLFDIQLVLSRTLTYGVLVGAVVGLYALLLFGAKRLLGDSTAGGVLAVALVAVAVQPAYSVLRRRIERWVYGYRADPAAALRRLGASLESADPLQVVEAITSSVADALKVDRVWVSPPGDEASPDPTVIRVSLIHRGELVGDLAVQVPTGRRLSAADTALLDDHARYASVTIRAAQLAGELQASRLRIVSAREEERKRLRRELHDGVGPSLAAILLKLEAARSRDDVTERNALLAEIRDETKAAITEVRRAVDELRPPAIDEVGLPGAIRQRAASLSTDLLAFRVESPQTLPTIPAAVEVAAFRIASEAMTNVAKHSGASRCSVSLEFDQALQLTVSDNGRGSGRFNRSGVGWTSMTERAAELGGSCTISSRGEGGLVVRAVLPLREDVGIEVLR
jgi:two-component system NarL family sensor kinase